MKMRTLFIANAVIQFLFGTGFLFAPAVLLSLFGTQTDTTGITLAHVAGGVILSLAIISWLGKMSKALLRMRLPGAASSLHISRLASLPCSPS